MKMLRVFAVVLFFGIFAEARSPAPTPSLMDRLSDQVRSMRVQHFFGGSCGGDESGWFYGGVPNGPATEAVVADLASVGYNMFGYYSDPKIDSKQVTVRKEKKINGRKLVAPLLDSAKLFEDSKQGVVNKKERSRAYQTLSALIAEASKLGALAFSGSIEVGTDVTPKFFAIELNGGVLLVASAGCN